MQLQVKNHPEDTAQLADVLRRRSGENRRRSVESSFPKQTDPGIKSGENTEDVLQTQAASNVFSACLSDKLRSRRQMTKTLYPIKIYS